MTCSLSGGIFAENSAVRLSFIDLVGQQFPHCGRLAGLRNAECADNVMIVTVNIGLARS
jgi:hypothetical protein